MDGIDRPSRTRNSNQSNIIDLIGIFKNVKLIAQELYKDNCFSFLFTIQRY